ncbi:MAG: hypothetical protein Q8L87_11830 [Anaerolineales bacterium]|nr:hypothetical protein [Anaerolineales bacterium]
MKRIIPFLLLLSLLAACAAPQAQTEPPMEVSESQPAATPTVEEVQIAPQSATPPEDTLLPNEIDAPLIDAPSIINIEMQDEVYGWAVTEKFIIRTNDGGVTWYNVTPPGLTEAGYSVFPEFFDISHAWIQVVDPNNYPNGGTLHYTSDGGITWESVETPFSAGDMEFVDADNGWILADLGVGAGSMAVSVFQTKNGGKTWSRVYTNDPNLEDAGETLPLGGLKFLIAPLDMEIAWVGGVVYAPGSVYLFRTDDAGKTWFNINLILPEEAAASELAVEKLHFVSDLQGFLVLRMTSQSPKTLIFLTDDGGNTWQPLPEILPRASWLETPSAQEIVFYSGNQFYVTKDAGQTFEVVDPNVKFGEAITDMSFVNSSTGWVITTSATGKRTLYKTTDGGQTWFSIIP